MKNCVVWITVPDRETGEKIAFALVQSKLAACVNIISGLTSIYSWKGKIEKELEELLMIKTRVTLVEKLIDMVTRLHPYEVPEIISSPIEKGFMPYMQWIEDETAGSE